MPPTPYEMALEAIRKVYKQDGTAAETRSDLQALRDEIEMMIDSLPKEEEEGADGGFPF